MVILVIGLPGSGKSYFAGKLAQKIGAEYYNSDQIRVELFSERTYSNSEKAKVYNILFEKMLSAIEKERDIVLDATFQKKEIRDQFIMNSSKICFIEIWAEESLIQERLKKNRPYSEADFKVYQVIKSEWEPLKRPHLKLESTNNNIDVMLGRAEKFLKDENRTNREASSRG